MDILSYILSKKNSGSNPGGSGGGSSGEITPEKAIACLVKHPQGDFGKIIPMYAATVDDSGFLPSDELLESMGMSGNFKKKLYYATFSSGIQETDKIPSGSVLLIEEILEIKDMETMQVDAEYNIYGLRGGNMIDSDDYQLTNVVNALNNGKMATIEVAFSTSDITLNSGNILRLCMINPY